MNSHRGRLFKLIEPCSKSRRWVYILCAAVVSLVALWGASMMGTFVVTVAYLPVIAICLAQFARPTRLGWSLLVVIFSAYAVVVFFKWRELTRLDFLAFLLIIVAPDLALFWSRPKGIA